MHQFFRQIDGAEVGVGVVASAQGQEGAAFGLFVDGDFLGFFEAESDGAFEDGIGVVADGFGFVGEGGAVIEPGFSSEGCVSEVEFRVGCLFDFFEDVDAWVVISGPIPSPSSTAMTFVLDIGFSCLLAWFGLCLNGFERRDNSIFFNDESIFFESRFTGIRVL